MKDQNPTWIELSWFTDLKGDSELKSEKDSKKYTKRLRIQSYDSIESNDCLYYGVYLFNLLNIRDIGDSNSNDHAKNLRIMLKLS